MFNELSMRTKIFLSFWTIFVLTVAVFVIYQDDRSLGNEFQSNFGFYANHFTHHLTQVSPDQRDHCNRLLNEGLGRLAFSNESEFYRIFYFWFGSALLFLILKLKNEEATGSRPWLLPSSLIRYYESVSLVRKLADS